jgi:ABC-type transport system substrate-binding protein
MVRRILPSLLLASLALASCGRQNDGSLEIAYIDAPSEMFAGGNRLSSSAQHLRAGTGAGLVTLDEHGDVVPALADQWIVTDDGRSFIFRMRDGNWPDGRPLTANSVRAAFSAALKSLRGTSLGIDLAPVEEVKAMAGRVIEIRLSSPVPTLLQLLAQPELALTSGRGGSGPMTLERRGNIAVLRWKAPAQLGLPEAEDWRSHVRPILLHPVSAKRALAMFDEGSVDLVLGGGLSALPLAPTGPLSRGTVQLDPAIGLFGLQVRRANGLLSTSRGREAVAMAIDREALIANYNIGGWSPTTRVVPPGLPGETGPAPERWNGQSIEALRAEAARRVAAWRTASDGRAHVSVAIDRGLGTDRLFRELSAQLGTIGIVLDRRPQGEADLVLIDRVARYAAPAWFLGQFNCALRRGMCDGDSDKLLLQAQSEGNPAERAKLLAQAETTLTLANVYIPFGTPLRWSLVRSKVTGFAPNQWAFHPLPPLAVFPK